MLNWFIFVHSCFLTNFLIFASITPFDLHICQKHNREYLRIMASSKPREPYFQQAPPNTQPFSVKDKSAIVTGAGSGMS